MKIHTLWHKEDGSIWLVEAADEESIMNGGADAYRMSLSQSPQCRRVLIVEIPDKAVNDIFTPPTVAGKT